MNDVPDMPGALDMSQVAQRKIEMGQRVTQMHERFAERFSDFKEADSVTPLLETPLLVTDVLNVQLDPLLYADIEINALQQQVVEKDIELLKYRLEQLKERQRVLMETIQKITGRTAVDRVTVVDREKRIVAVG